MPSDDLILNVRQIDGYASASSALPTDALILQRGGLGGPYLSIDPVNLVATALAQGGSMSIAGDLGVQAVQGGSLQFSNAAVGMFSAQKACVVDFAATFGTLGGVPIATQSDVAAAIAGVRAASVWSFNGRVGDVRLWIDDIRCAGGAPIYSPRFEGSPRACTPPPTSNSSRLATTAYVTTALGVAFAAYAPLDSPNFTGLPTAPTAAQGSADGQLATTAFVANAVADSTTGVASFNGRTGIVALVGGDITAGGGALLASPVFTGTPSAPTQPSTDNSTRLATTAFVASFAAPLASPAFTGVPTAPTAASGTSTTQLATTAFVTQAITAGLAGTVTTFNGRAGAVNLIANDVSAAGGALLAGPAFTGAPTAPTAAPGTTTAQIATCAYVQAAVATGGGVLTFNGRAGAVTLTAADLSGVGGALLASPSFTGFPLAPTATPGTSTTQIATTAFVMAAVAAGTAGVASFNTRTGAVSLIATDVTAVLPPSATTPAMDGTASAGTVNAWSRGDHVHPTDTSRYAASNPSGFQTAAQVSASLAAYLPLSGGVMTAGSGLQVGSQGIVTSGLISLTGSGGLTVAAPSSFANSLTVSGTGSGVNTITMGTPTNPLLFFGGGRLWMSTSTSTVILDNQAAGGGTISLNADGSFEYNGNVAYKGGGGTWTAPSDERIKTVKGEYDKGLSDVLALRPVTFVYKGNDTPTADPSAASPDPRQPRYGGSAPYPGSPHYRVAKAGTEFVGFVAQELEAVFPAMVAAKPGFIDGRAVTDLRTVDVSELTYALVNAVKTLAARVAALEAT
jgi:Chaperone of endosialidase